MNDHEGRITTKKGKLLHTTNGGDNWDIVIPFPSDNVTYFTDPATAMSFVGSIKGWLIGSLTDSLQNDIGGVIYNGWLTGDEGCIASTSTSRKLTDVENDYEFPNSFIFNQNYPNPFNSSTTIKDQLPAKVKSEMANVKLIIYDILGREVTTLVNEQQKPGNYEIEFDGSEQTSGVYFYSLKAGDYIETKKMITYALLKAHMLVGFFIVS